MSQSSFFLPLASHVDKLLEKMEEKKKVPSQIIVEPTNRLRHYSLRNERRQAKKLRPNNAIIKVVTPDADL